MISLPIRTASVRLQLRHAQVDAQGAPSGDVCAVSAERTPTKVESPARRRCNALWLRQQLADLATCINGLAPVDRDNAIANILSGVAWRGDR